MEFQDLIEEFFKQYTTSLGVEPNLKAEFESASQYDDYVDFTPGKPKGSIKKLPKVFYSPRLPFDYTEEEQEAAREAKKKLPRKGVTHPDKINEKTKKLLYHTPLNEPFKLLMSRYGIVPDYDLELKLVAIARAQHNENYSLQHTIKIINRFHEKYWNNRSLTYGQVKFDDGTKAPAVHIPEEIIDQIQKWMSDRHQRKEEITEPHGLIVKMHKDLTLKRVTDIYHKLLENISGISIMETKDWDIEKHISDLLHNAKQKGITHLKPGESIEDLPEDYHAQEFKAVTGYTYPSEDGTALDKKSNEMGFIQKAEDFVRQMSYSISFDPQPVYQGKKGFYSLMTHPDDLFKTLNMQNIDYPFKPEVKIIELEGLMKQEKLSPLKAIKIVKNYVDHYWAADTVLTDKRIFENIASAVKKDEGSDKNVLREQAKYTDYCKSIRQKHFEELMTELGLTAEIADELGFPEWLTMKNLSASIKMERGGSIKFNPNKDGDVHIDFNSDKIADAFIEYGKTKNKESLTEDEKALALKKFNDAIEEEKKRLNGYGEQFKEASDSRMKTVIGTSNLRPKNLDEMLARLQTTGLNMIQEYENTASTDTEKERHLRKELLLIKLNEIEKYKKLCIESKQNLESPAYKELVRIENELKLIKKDILSSSKTPDAEKKTASPEKESSEDLESLPSHSFDGKTFEEIYEYFSERLVGANKDKPKYLEDDKLREYITLAYFKQKLPERQFSFLNFSEKKGKIRSIFFGHYQTLPEKLKDRKRYARLLSDYFTQYEYKNTLGNWKK